MITTITIMGTIMITTTTMIMIMIITTISMADWRCRLLDDWSDLIL
jgi:hypothetical protein